MNPNTRIIRYRPWRKPNSRKMQIIGTILLYLAGIMTISAMTLVRIWAGIVASLVFVVIVEWWFMTCRDINEMEAQP